VAGLNTIDQDVQRSAKVGFLSSKDLAVSALRETRETRAGAPETSPIDRLREDPFPEGQRNAELGAIAAKLSGAARQASTWAVITIWVFLPASVLACKKSD